VPTSLHSIAWRFGGPLSGLPPAFAWTLLLLVGALGAAWIIISYRRTLVALAPAHRRVLVALRLLLWAGLLALLAGPVRIERTYAPKIVRPLAVLVDQSASMTTPDNRRQRRLDDALRHWRTLAPAASAAHGEPRVFAFADTSAPAAISAADASPSLPSGQTRLFTSIDRLLADAPPGGWAGLVTLTDGLDTTITGGDTTALAATSRSALASGTPLYLINGRNRYAGGPFIALRDLSVPGQVPPRSTFHLELTLDSYQPASRTLPLRIKVGDTWREPATLRFDAGRRALVWETEISAEAPGLLPLEIAVGDAPDAPRARAEIRVAAPTSTRILYYQGALDWGYRFLADILRRDPAFALTPLFNLAPNGAGRARPASASLPSLPATAAGYDAYDVVVLANATADQFSADQQAALTAWVRGGGVLLFLAPDDASTSGFSGSELEKMLPVVFAPAGAKSVEAAEVSRFRSNMRQLGGSHTGTEVGFAQNAFRSTREPVLSTFAWEPRALALLGAELGATTPVFANYARVRQAKPGAEVLARHPSDQTRGGEGRAILLALQRYGRGQSAVLTSDALWRWKLNQPSRERGVEKFWQNLFAWLGREHTRGIRFERPPLLAEKHRELILRVIAPAGALTVTASPGEATATEPAAPLTLIAAGEEAGARLFRWTPPADGSWIIEARAADATPARHWLTVATPPGGEASGLPPDENVLRALAERTGGAVLGDAPPAVWQAAASAPAAALLREQIEPLWHRGWIFAALLSVYAAELVLRRRRRLL
jgi:hypothetical protein